jgi:hypothetical protein
MRFRQLARKLLDGYRRAFASDRPFFPAWEDEVEQAVTEDELQAQLDAERQAKLAQHQRDNPADAPSDRTTSVRPPGAGLGRTVTYVGRFTPAADPAAPVARRSAGGA